jgi:hypothetical protein
MGSNDFPLLAKQFFDKYLENNPELNGNIFLCRADGVMIFSKSDIGKEIDEASIGALIGGVWQASNALADFIPSKKENKSYRLSFDTSSSGIYILPVNVGTKEFYLGTIYSDEINPGFLKSKFRNLYESLHKYFKANYSTESGVDDKSLFNNITDEEMDNLFSFAGN